MREEHIIDALNLLDTDIIEETDAIRSNPCLLYTSPSPRDRG